MKGLFGVQIKGRKVLINANQLCYVEENEFGKAEVSLSNGEGFVTDEKFMSVIKKIGASYNKLEVSYDD